MSFRHSNSTPTTTYMLIRSQDQADTAPGAELAMMHIDVSAETAAIFLAVRTDTASQLAWRLSASNATSVVKGLNFGYLDRRGRDD